MVVIEYEAKDGKGIQRTWVTTEEGPEPVQILARALFLSVAGDTVVSKEEWNNVVRPKLRRLGVRQVLIDDRTGG